MVEAAMAALLLAATPVLSVGAGNALTLPAQRHLVRIDPGSSPATYLLAINQHGAEGHGLRLFRSNDEGDTWRVEGVIQDDYTHPDRADLIAVGMDVALVYSYEDPKLAGSTRHDVYFQWWRHSAGSWRPDPAVRIFDSTSSSTGFYRAELARDGQGRLWVQAFKLESNGTHTAAIAVSVDGGRTFSAQPPLASLPRRGGGRLLWLGGTLLFLYDMHDDLGPSRFRVRADSAPLSSWSAEQQAFSDGIYHGAALSAVGDGGGGMHLVYKDELSERLFYRYFDGAAFGPRTLLDDRGDWALQPALTRLGDELVLFYNRSRTVDTDYELRARRMTAGIWSDPVVLDGTQNYKGYPAAAEVLPTSVSRVPCFFGSASISWEAATEQLVFYPWDGAPPPPDGGTPDAGTPDAGTPDGGEPPAGTLLVADDFERTASSGLGPDWHIARGLWRTLGFADSDLDGDDLATAHGAACASCRVEASVVSFGVPEVAIFARAPSLAANDRYDLALLGNGKLQLRRHRAGTVTVLGEVASGISSLDEPAILSLSVSGAGPVTLVGAVDGVPRISATDTSVSALTGSGYSGLWTTRAGVWFDDFRLWSEATGTPDAGTPDAGTPDAGTPDAGTPDAGTPDAGAPDAGAPDAGTPDGGAAPLALVFSDDFERTSDSNLGPSWDLLRGLWLTRDRAISDLDGSNQAAPAVAPCAQCRVEADVIGFGVPEVGLFVRADPSSPSDRYEVLLLPNGNIRIRRLRAGGVVVLGEGPSGVADLGDWARLSLEVSGSGPVNLVASVNGIPLLSAVDSSGQALTGAGRAGLWTNRAGVWFDNFRLWAAPAPAPGGGTLSLQVSFTSAEYVFLAVSPGGKAFATRLSESASRLYASSDGRTWSFVGAHPTGAAFRVMTALSDGTLLANTLGGGRHALFRSTDEGASWVQVLDLGAYQMLTPHSVAELNGDVYFIEYQTFTTADTPIRLWRSADRGQTWSIRHTFNGHRHAHGVIADPPRNALWALFGDTTAQSGIYRSTDGGASWVLVQGGQEGDVVDAVPLSDGSLLFGQDISYQPPRPAIARVGPSGGLTTLQPLSGPSYSIHPIRAGGFVVGAARESGGDVYAPGEESVHLFVSADGARWSDALQYPRLSTTADARADVYWELASGELVVQLDNVQGVGPGGKGYQLLRVVR